MTTMVCTARTGTAWSRHDCGRPIKDDGLCGIHLAARKRVEANEARRTAQRAQRERTKESRQRQAKAYSEALGIPVVEMWPRDFASAIWPNRFEISGEHLDALVERLAQLKPGQQPPEKPEPQK